LTAPTTTFAAYARGLERGERIPNSLLKIVGSDPTPYQVLQHLVSRSERRQKGTFFTSSETAVSLWKNAIDTIRDGSVIVDPACGAGDLLAPAAARIIESHVSNVVLRACDIEEDLTRIATARLRNAVDPLRGRVEGVAVDFLHDDKSVKDATHVVLNPPYVPIMVNEPWASGRVNAAALFTIRALEAMRSGSRLLAILPDVLRSGSRYSAWRRRVEDLSAINLIETHGLFDKQTDVHVFVLDVTVGLAQEDAANWSQAPSTSTLMDFADVRVGPVVPHRDPEFETLYRYVTARSLSSGEVLHRGFAGRKERGPFVLVNRTSRPGESPRVRARLWADTDEVAVENHLLIVVPKDRVSCSEVIEVLSSGESADFLDNRIRCRHLTVKALREIPWPI
jgi:hypothetical protein